jgi:hypothetical protein
VDFSFEKPSKARFCKVLKMKNTNLHPKVEDSMFASDYFIGISNPKVFKHKKTHQIGVF